MKTLPPHDPAISIPDALYRAMMRCAGSAKQDVKFRIADFLFRLKPRDTTIRAYSQPSHTRTYLGHVSSRSFCPVSTITPSDRDAVLSILQDPKRAAIEHGKTTGCCAICNTVLTDPASLLLGIGPVCLSNWGWDDDAMSLEDLL